MSSLAAARADNFYYPPGYDPDKHGSLNKFQGQHPLRDRARKLGEGILIIRFEVPFNIWCDQCGEHIAKGVRFNADKKQVGAYHSTKIWAFTMRHHCGCKITIQTDPQNAEYIVTDGARRKIEQYDAEDAQTIELPDANEQAAEAMDPLASLEKKTVQAQRAAEGRRQLSVLAEESQQRNQDSYALNKQLRAAMRQSKKETAKLNAKRQALGLPEHIQLLPEAAADQQAAQLALFQQRDSKFQHNWQDKRRKVMTDSIFPGGSGDARQDAAAAVAGPGLPRSSSSRGHRLPSGTGVTAAAQQHSAKQQLQQRLLAVKRKKQLQQSLGAG
eukprot:GHUV01018211.1.p1 GENE.GHUV01018211.1~~GHUV01018211.1.p1  ORF type:complete len:329 (+),score=119.30 GHUV01018211.1:768-1754(+)